MLQPEHVSLALRPQFQQVSLESACWLIVAIASSAACLRASNIIFSIFPRSVATNSLAFTSAAATAFCNSTTACRLTSFTASSSSFHFGHSIFRRLQSLSHHVTSVLFEIVFGALCVTTYPHGQFLSVRLTSVLQDCQSSFGLLNHAQNAV